jgi:hypothetical protein
MRFLSDRQQALDSASSSTSCELDGYSPDLGLRYLPIDEFHDVFRAILGWTHDLG